LNKAESNRLEGILAEIKLMLRKYLQGQGLISLLSGLTVGCYFFIVGLPYGLVFAAISAVAELAPVVGPTVAAVLAAVLSYSYTPLLAAKTLLFYILMLKINHNLVYPSLIGKATQLHPVAIVAGVLFLGHIFGVLGMILAVPVLAVIKIIFEHYVRERRVITKS
jgi:predicted PurR-regulated permease PerM